MLSFARRFRLIFIRFGLCLIAVVSLAAIVVLLSQSILASAAGTQSKTVATNSHVPALTLKPDSGVGEVQLISSGDELASIERARSQMPSLVNANNAIDWSALSDLDDTELLPTTFEEIDEITLIAGMDPAFADWVPLGGQVAQLASADDSNSGSFGGGGGGARNGWSGGGGGGAGGLGSGGGSGGSGASRLAGSVDGSNGFSGVAGDGIDVRSANSASNSQSGANSNGTNGNANGTNGNANGTANANGVSTAPGLAGDVPPGLAGSGGVGATSTTTTTSVPEPSTLLLMAVGLSSLTMSLRRRRVDR
jgi:hypothetical protein